MSEKLKETVGEADLHVESGPRKITEEDRRFSADMTELCRTTDNLVEATGRLERALKARAAERAREVPAGAPAVDFGGKGPIPRTLLEIVRAPDASSAWEQEVSRRWLELQQLHGVFKSVPGYEGPRQFSRGREFERLLTKADHWVTNVAAEGGDTTVGLQDWVSVFYRSDIIDVYTLEPKIASIWRGANLAQMPRGAGSMRVPVATSEGSCLPLAEAASADTSLLVAATGQGATDYVELTAKTHRAGLTMSMEFEEDTVVATMAVANSIVRRDLMLGMDDAILNGTATANDSNLDGTNDHNAAGGMFNGLRYWAHYSPGSMETNIGTQPLDSDYVAAARSSMGKFAVNPEECALIVGPAGYLSLIRDATNAAVVTREKYGDAATILTGELAKVWGIPVVVTDRMHENMNGTNGDAATTGTTTGAILVNWTRWVLGIKKSVEIRIVPSPATNQVGVYGFTRFALDDAPPTTDKHTWYLYNIALA